MSSSYAAVCRKLHRIHERRAVYNVLFPFLCMLYDFKERRAQFASSTLHPWYWYLPHTTLDTFNVMFQPEIGRESARELAQAMARTISAFETRLGPDMEDLGGRK